MPKEMSSRYYPTPTTESQRAFDRWRYLLKDCFATQDVVDHAYQAYLATLREEKK